MPTPLDLYPIIKPLLSQYKSLFIPGLGTFYMTNVPSKVDTIHDTLLPPDTILSFEAGSKGDGQILYSEIIKRFSVDNSVASESVIAFSRHIHEELRMGHNVEIPALGRLYHNLNQQIAFAPRLKILDSDSFGLPAIPFSENRAVPDPILTELNTDPLPPPIPPVPKNPIFKFILLSLLIVGLSVGLYFFWFSPSFKESSSYIKEKWMMFREKFTTWNGENQDTKPLEDVVEIVSDSLPPVDDFSETEDARSADLPEKEEKESVVAGEMVKIAVGVYGNPENAARMVAKIERAGFKAFSEKSGSLTKVGVVQKYHSLGEKLEILEKVKRDVEKSAVMIN
jgi:hypothetical protein